MMAARIMLSCCGGLASRCENANNIETTSPQHICRQRQTSGIRMFMNAAIIGVGQSAYVRRPQSGQSTHTFIRDAVVAALRDGEIDAGEIQGMAVTSFSSPPTLPSISHGGLACRCVG